MKPTLRTQIADFLGEKAETNTPANKKKEKPFVPIGKPVLPAIKPNDNPITRLAKLRQDYAQNKRSAAATRASAKSYRVSSGPGIAKTVTARNARYAVIAALEQGIVKVLPKSGEVLMHVKPLGNFKRTQDDFADYYGFRNSEGKWDARRVGAHDQDDEDGDDF